MRTQRPSSADVTPPDGRGHRWGRLSLEIKLPLVITALLLAVLGAYTWIGYTEVAHTARSAAAQRNARLAGELAELTGARAEDRQRIVANAAASPALRTAILSRSFDIALPVLDTIRGVDNPETRAVVFARDAKPLLVIGEVPPAEALTYAISLFPDAARTYGESVASPLFESRRNAYFWRVAAVRDADTVIGYLAQIRQFAISPEMQRTLQNFIGEGSRVLYANVNNGHLPWAMLDGSAIPPPDIAIVDQDGFRYRRNGEWFIGGRREIKNTPYVTVVETPTAQTEARAHEFLRRTGMLALLLLLAAGITVWIASRRITRPIRDLNAAARAMEAGQLQQHVHTDRKDELGELAYSFNKMAAEVQRAMRAAEESRVEAMQANQAKSEFLANMSHEIRTPINAILGYTDLIDLGVAGEVTEEQRAHLERIRVSGNHLIGLIDDLLDFARLDVARLNVEKAVASAADSVQTALTVVEPQAKAKSLKLEVDCEPNLQYVGDAQRVEQILVNLLGNAVKFTAAEGTIRVECSSTTKDGRRKTSFTVSDTGVGIPAERLDAIFEPFVQAQGGYTRPHGGTGLGLAISRRLAELMDGSISVESVVDQGSRFTLTLPAPG